MDGHEALMAEFEFFKRAKHIKKITEEVYLFVYFIFENIYQPKRMIYVDYS